MNLCKYIWNYFVYVFLFVRQSSLLWEFWIDIIYTCLPQKPFFCSYFCPRLRYAFVTHLFIHQYIVIFVRPIPMKLTFATKETSFFIGHILIVRFDDSSVGWKQAKNHENTRILQKHDEQHKGEWHIMKKEYLKWKKWVCKRKWSHKERKCVVRKIDAFLFTHTGIDVQPCWQPARVASS